MSRRERKRRALLAALTLNRGELDPRALERLLRLTEPKPDPRCPTLT